MNISWSLSTPRPTLNRTLILPINVLHDLDPGDEQPLPIDTTSSFANGKRKVFDMKIIFPYPAEIGTVFKNSAQTTTVVAMSAAEVASSCTER